jgi:uncharacterized membrane protein
MTWFGKGTRAILGALLLLVASPLSSSLALANNPITSEALTLTLYLDGFVLVNHELTVNQTFPTINTTLLSETHEELLIVDEQNLPLDYIIMNNEVVIDSLGASQIKISYFTPDLTSKTGKYWMLNAEVTTNTTVTLPETASIISLNNVPEFIESSNGQVSLVMPSGIIEISYVSDHDLYQKIQTIEAWQLIAIPLILIIAAIAFAIWFMRRKKPPSQPKEHKREVDVNKLFEREKHLRPEEVQVIQFLAEKHGTAFEAELYEKLNLPRTTTWRLLKRLEKMEIVNIRKSRRQNIVSVRKKYLKK